MIYYKLFPTNFKLRAAWDEIVYSVKILIKKGEFSSKTHLFDVQYVVFPSQRSRRARMH